MVAVQGLPCLSHQFLALVSSRCEFVSQFVSKQQTGVPWSTVCRTAQQKDIRLFRNKILYIKLVILLSFLPLATQRHFPSCFCCFLQYCNSAPVEGIPSLLPDLLPSFVLTKEKSRQRRDEEKTVSTNWLLNERQQDGRLNCVVALTQTTIRT
jgi:hypothetical protein